VPDLVSIDDLLSHPSIWRGQDGDSMRTAAIPTGFEPLDRYLPGGGWPLTGVTEIFVHRYGIGELGLLMPALAALCAETVAVRQWIVWIAPPFLPYAPALLHHGVDLNRILLVHPSGSRVDALWATEQVIKSQSSAAVLAWIEEADMAALRRLQLGAEEHECLTVLFRPAAALSGSSPAALRLELSRASAESERDRICMAIHKCRGRRPGTIFIDRAGPHSAGRGFDAGGGE
jgi:cell division inhibitor SulA/protein ImuA